MQPKFKLGQRVYFVLGGDDSVGIVTGIIYPPSSFVYLVTWANKHESDHSDIELASEPVRDFAD